MGDKRPIRPNLSFIHYYYSQIGFWRALVALAFGIETLRGIGFGGETNPP